ncbi:hypothetical protein EHM69_07765 [candidate division KSB1 bacterium]|nr:MAG: hypothetical protein EHM69_07765 [candidate division KSB1 bacterium]
MDGPYTGGNRQQGGYVMVAMIATMTIMVAISAAYMRWSTDESLQSARTAAAMQAYYLGQMGIVEKGFQWLRTRPASDLPVGETVLSGKTVPGVGEYSTVRIFYLPSLDEGNFWAVDRKFRISSVGTVHVPYRNGGRENYAEIKRQAVLYVQVRNFCDYMYLSDQEMTHFNDRIKFWSGDTLQGRVHSNSQIAIQTRPVFLEQVSTTEDNFWLQDGANPDFRVPPIFNAPRVEIPQMAERLRQGASQQGHYFDYPGKTLRAEFRRGSVHICAWNTGTPYDENQCWDVVLHPHCCIFVNGPLEIMGIVEGQVTIGSAGTMRILDNIRYSDANPYTGVTSLQSSNVLGIVSEADIKIANTAANGRENSSGLGSAQTNPDLTDIVITGAVVALGESFTFEDQNDPDSGYVCACNPDNRGTIYLYGSLTQMRRGYVHRRNNTSTGYLKKYVYDDRFMRTRPPCFFDVTDENGHALFNIVQWGQGKENAVDVRYGNVVRYN